MALDPRIEIIREKYGLDKDDFWELPQKKGTWVAKHAALEVAAAKAGIEFDNPQVIEAVTEAGIAVVSVRGSLPADPDKRLGRAEWSIGEASPKNNKNAYPWAMAEKRAKDRVILKLIGIHGLVYSEEEADFDKPTGAAPTPRFEEQPEMANTAAKEHWRTIADAMFACTTLKQLQGAWQRHYPVYQTLPEGLQKELVIWKDELKDKLMALAEAPKAAVPANFEKLESATQ